MKNTTYKINQLDAQSLFSNQNYESIENDFWIYRFEIDTKKVGYEYSLIDDLKQELSCVKSVVYLKGKCFFALFDKKSYENDFQLEDNINEIINHADEVIFYKIDNIRNHNEKTNGISKRSLAQLLFNTLANSNKGPKDKLSNITGGLYQIVKSRLSKQREDKERVVWQYTALKIELDYHLHLMLEVKNFSSLIYIGKNRVNFSNRKRKLKDYTRYKIINDGQNIKRLKINEYNKTPSNTYLNIQLDGKKVNVPFLDLKADSRNGKSSYDKFMESKSGVLFAFVENVNHELSQYLTVEFKKIPFNDEDKLSFNNDKAVNISQKILNFCRNTPLIINIADSLKDEKRANNLAKELKNSLTDNGWKYQFNNVKIDNLEKDALNIRIIKDKAEYEKGKDEYLESSEYLVHHITLKNFKIKSKKELVKPKYQYDNSIDVILKELYIKNDLKCGKISIIDWNYKNCIFIEREATKVKEGDKYRYKILEISPNGALEFEKCEPNERFQNNFYEYYKTIYEKYGKYNGQEFIKGLIVYNKKDINIIYDTSKFTIQDIEQIGSDLQLEATPKMLLRKDIEVLIENFIKNSTLLNSAKKQRFQNLLKIIKNYKPKFSKQELLQKLNLAKITSSGRNHLLGQFCKFYQKQTGDVLKVFMRGQEEKEFFFGSKLDIYYHQYSSDQARYFVGKKSNNVNYPFNHATNIRIVKAVRNRKHSSRIIFKELLDTLNVDFVKHKEFTVMPFPFKYLREYSK